METGGRLTRAQARLLEQETGTTPLLAKLPDKTPATRRKTMPRTQLGEITNAARTAAEDIEAAAPAQSVCTSVDAEAVLPVAAPTTDEPPATPATSIPASPKQACPVATPTGLGLSDLPPMSPMSAVLAQNKTPAATPVAGIPSPAAAKVADALQAAVQALGGEGVPASPLEEGELPAAGFGSPVRQAESPTESAVSIGVAIGAAGATPVPAVGDDIMSVSPVPGTVRFECAHPLAGGEDDQDLVAMLRTPTFEPSEELCGAPTPTFGAAAAAPTPSFGPGAAAAVPVAPVASAATAVGAAAMEPKAPTPVVVCVPAAVPMGTPSRQIVLDEEEAVDYVMETSEAVAAEEDVETGMEASSPAPATAADMVAEAEAVLPAAVEEAAAEAATAQPALVAAPTLKSKVVVASPSSFDPRSLRQLKKEISEKMAAKAAATASLTAQEEEESGDEGESVAYDVSADATGTAAELAEAMGGLSLGGGGIAGPLRGLPTPAGMHIRFDEDGKEAVSPRTRVYLRGLPAPEGKHIVFEEDE